MNTLTDYNPDRFYVKLWTDVRQAPLVVLVDSGSDVSVKRKGICDVDLGYPSRYVFFGKTKLEG